MKYIKLIIIVILISSLPITVGSVSANSLKDFNVIAFGNLDGTNEAEGRTLVMGDINPIGSIQLVFDANALLNPTTGVTTLGLNQNDGVIVGGTISGSTTINMNSSLPANIRVGGADDSATINNLTGTLTYDDPGVAGIISAVTNDVTAMDSYLAGLTNNSTVDLSDFNNAVFNSTPVDGVAVFDVGASFWNRNGGFDLTGSDANLYVIRVAGTGSLTTGSGLNVFNNEFNIDDYQRRIIWDFSGYDGDLFFTKGLGGAMFAPDANVNMGSPLEGTVVANSITMGAEIHMPYLDSSVLDDIGATPIPEPSTMMLLGFGMLFVSGIARRRMNNKTT